MCSGNELDWLWVYKATKSKNMMKPETVLYEERFEEGYEVSDGHFASSCDVPRRPQRGRHGAHGQRQIWHGSVRAQTCRQDPSDSDDSLLIHLVIMAEVVDRVFSNKQSVCHSRC